MAASTNGHHETISFVSTNRQEEKKEREREKEKRMAEKRENENNDPLIWPTKEFTILVNRKTGPQQFIEEFIKQ